MAEKYGTPKAALLLARKAVEAAGGNLVPDFPELDGTDAAHPAWWRGEQYGTAALCRDINKLLDDPEGEAWGTCGEPWGSTRRRLYELAKKKSFDPKDLPLHFAVLLADAHAWSARHPEPEAFSRTPENMLLLALDQCARQSARPDAFLHAVWRNLYPFHPGLERSWPAVEEALAKSLARFIGSERRLRRLAHEAAKFAGEGRSGKEQPPT